MSIQPDLPPLSEPPLSPPPVNAEPVPAPPAVPAAPLLRAAPDPDPAPAMPSQVTLEAQLLRFRLVAPDQMSQAMRIEAETGKPVAETVVEQGWVTPGDLQTVIASLDPNASQAAPEPEPVPEPEPAPAPAAEAPSPAPDVPEEPAAPVEPPAAVLEPVPAPAPVEPARIDPEPTFTTPATPAPQEPEPELPPAAVTAPEPAPAAGPVAPPAGQQTRVLVRLRAGDELVAGSYDDPATARQHAKELVEEVQSDDAWLFVAGRSLAPVDIDRIYLG
ncbi:MAG TPA: hypothetical protein VH416_07085 [Gaiellaceae bacterium]